MVATGRTTEAEAGGPPTWGSIERRPEIGLEKKWRQMAEEKASAKHRDWRFIKGSVWNAANVEAARYNAKTKKWEKCARWLAMQRIWETFFAERSPCM